MNYKKVKTVLKSDITLLDYIILVNSNNNSLSEFESDSEFSNHFTELKKLGYLSLNNKLTPKGKVFIDNIDNIVPESTDWYEYLHKRLQDKLIELTGKKQKMLQGNYAFLCNKIDLQKKIDKVRMKYKLSNKDKIEELLINYIEKCDKKNFDYVQLVEYYIMKDNVSKLATEYFSVEKEEKPQDNAVNI